MSLSLEQMDAATAWPELDACDEAMDWGDLADDGCADDPLPPEEPPEEWVPAARSAHEYESLAETDANARRWVLGITAVEASKMFEFGGTDDNVDILQSLHEAADGSDEARKMVKRNVATAVVEALYKVDHASESTMDVNEHGELEQLGHTSRSIQYNSLHLRQDRDPIVKAITMAELHNAWRIRQLMHEGVLDDNTFVAISLVPNGLPEEKLDHRGEGYFMATFSYSIQATTRMPDGSMRTQAAFMAGVETPDNTGFEERMARRHDFAAIAKLYEWFGQEAPETAADILDKPLVIPNAMMPNGVSDIMYYCDAAADAVLGRQQDRDRDDYTSVYDRSAQREAKLSGVIDDVTDELIDKSADMWIPMEAVKAMWESVKNHTVKAALHNRDIDLRVFGAEAKAHIERAWDLLDSGQLEAASSAMDHAADVAVASGCGGGYQKETKESEEAAAKNGKPETDYGKMHCPFCKAEVWGDRCATNQYCHNCTAKVVNGKLVSRGNGGHASKESRRQARVTDIVEVLRKYAKPAA